MHIPDGFLSTPVWATLDVLSVPALGLLARRAQREVDDSRVPLLGVMGAFVFAAQMINFPVGAGTSGHLVGGALLATTLGPAAATVVMTAILAVQALIFQDGGILALGANVINIAIFGVLAGYLPYHFLGGGRWARLSVFLGGVLSVLVGACLALVELLISGLPAQAPLIGVSLGLFALTALIEGAISAAAWQAIAALNPSWVRKPTLHGRRGLAIVMASAVLLAAGLVVFASAAPDSLSALAERAGIADNARSLLAAPLSGYELRWFDAEWLRKASAGLAGVVLICGVCALLGRMIARHRSA